MAVLETLRVKFGILISVLVAIGLLSFIVDPNSIENAIRSISSKYDVGKINGKVVSYEDFQTELTKVKEINELMNNSQRGEEQEKQSRELAWQNLVDKFLFIKQAKNAGINVGKDEMIALTTGKMPAPMIVQNPIFFDEKGNFAKEKVVSFLKNKDNDNTGRLSLYWNFLQKSIYNQQFKEKYYSLFTQSNIKNNMMIERAVKENNLTKDVDYVMIPLTYQDDSLVTISKQEVNAYYKSHKKFFKQKAYRELDYVVFEVKPSESDITYTNNLIVNVYDEFSKTDNMKIFLMKNSIRPLSSIWYKDGELSTISPEINKFVFENKEGTSRVFQNGDYFRVARIMDTKKLPDSVYVRHILLQDKTAQSVADSLVKVLEKGENFSNLVAKHSVDQNSSVDGVLGNLGWMTQNRMIQGFEEIFMVKNSKPFIINTQYGTHIVEVVKRTKELEKKQVAILEKEVYPSKETFNSYYAKANKFATMASGSSENYKKALDSLSCYAHNIKITEASETYGSIEGAKAVTRWAFENKKGAVSNIITVNNKYFLIANVKDIYKEGYTPIETVYKGIEAKLKADKYLKMKKEEYAKKFANKSLDVIAKELSTSILNDKITFNSTYNPSIDLYFVGAVSSAEKSKLVGPVVSQRAVYFFTVKDVEEASFFKKDDYINNAQGMDSYSLRMLLPVMMEDAEVVDNRARFF